jgi:hypothetical protein
MTELAGRGLVLDNAQGAVLLATSHLNVEGRGPLALRRQGWLVVLYELNVGPADAGSGRDGNAVPPSPPRPLHD